MILEMGTGEISCHYPLVTGTSKGGRVDRGACLCGVLPLHPAWTKELLPWCGWLSKVVECRQELLQSECQRGVHTLMACMGSLTSEIQKSTAGG